jgi:hypothetical protein
MSAALFHKNAVGPMAYLGLALVPWSLLGWSILVVILRSHVSEAARYRMLDCFPYLAGAGALVLVAIPIRFRRSASFGKLTTVSVICGLGLPICRAPIPAPINLMVRSYC